MAKVTVGVRGGLLLPTPTVTADRRLLRCRPARVERGAVTAEAAMAIPVLLGLTLGLLWLVALAAAQVRVVDAAREVARSAARGDAVTRAVDAGRRVAPEGTSFTVRRGAEQVTVTARVRVKGPGGLFQALPGVTLRSTAVAVQEPR